MFLNNNNKHNNNKIHLSDKCPYTLFLGEFAELRKSVHLRHHVCLSVCMEQFGSHWKDLYKIWYSSAPPSPPIIQVSLKSDKNNGHFTWRPVYNNIGQD